jgi:streptogramin lyase
MVTTQSQVDGKVWTNNVGHGDIYRVDLATGKMEHFEPYKGLPDDAPQAHRPHAIYGLAADSHNNLFFTDFVGRWIGRIDAKTLQVSVWHTPTAASRPRRGRFDDAGHLWFAEYGANTVGMFDPKAEQFREYAMPTPWTSPYDVAADRNGEVWTASMFTDRVVRLDPKTGSTTEYPLPEPVTNIRRVFVDNSTSPVTFWAGSNHNAGILKVEPLD